MLFRSDLLRDAVVSGLYETGDTPDPTSFLKEDEVGNIKTIFWAYNIVDFSATLKGSVKVSSSGGEVDDLSVTGTWFNKDLWTINKFCHPHIY